MLYWETQTYTEFSMGEILREQVDGTSTRSSEMTVKKKSHKEVQKSDFSNRKGQSPFVKIHFLSVNKRVLGILFNLKNTLQCYEIQPLTISIQTTPPNHHILNLK